MQTYGMKCRKYTENIDPKMVRKKKQISYAIKMFFLWI